jgi:hypothetical protein
MVHACERGSVPLGEHEEAVCRHLLQVGKKDKKVFIGIPEGWNWNRWECADLQVGSTFPVDGTGVAFLGTRNRPQWRAKKPSRDRRRT